MSSLIGAALVWFLGNPDLLLLLGSFTLALGVIHTVFQVWHTVERGRDYER